MCLRFYLHTINNSSTTLRKLFPSYYSISFAPISFLLHLGHTVSAFL